MNRRDERRNVKAIRLLQQRSDAIEEAHAAIGEDIRAIKDRLTELADADELTPKFAKGKLAHLEAMSAPRSLPAVDVETIFDESEVEFPGDAGLNDILTPDDWAILDQRVAAHIQDFNARYDLDRWDYSIAGGCGLVAAMLHLLCVNAPASPTAKWTKEVDGVFNRWVQEAFNHFLSPEVSRELSRLNSIGGADASAVAQLVGAPPRSLNPRNHRLRALSHDPVLGFLFGVLDMRRGTCTVVNDGRLTIHPARSQPVDGSLFTLLGRLFGHLLSDVNAPSSQGNRGMGLPAPLMGVLRMFDGLPVGDSDLGKQVEYWYVNGYDFRQFCATSIPVLIMEVMMRVFYAVKQVKLNGASLGEALVETMPMKMNPRFRMMLVMAHGTVAAVNGARVYVTRDMLNLNYTAWLALVWNGFHAVRWALLDRSLRLWDEVETREVEALQHIVERIDALVHRAERLPA